MTHEQGREALGLSQAEAARQAGVGLVTWRRWEADPASVNPALAAKCQTTLEAAAAQRDQLTADDQARRDQMAKVAEAWAQGVLTPRQAYGLMMAIGDWKTELEDWLDQASHSPLHQVGPFAYFDKRAMMLVGDSTAFAAKAAERCQAVHDEIEKGALPFHREGCFFDEVLIAAALRWGEDLLTEMPELFEGLPERPGLEDGNEEEPEDDDDDDLWVADSQWDVVSDLLDNIARFDDWKVPVFSNDMFVPILLKVRHPFRWFDVGVPRPTMRETVREHFGLTERQFTALQSRTFVAHEAHERQKGDQA